MSTEVTSTSSQIGLEATAIHKQYPTPTEPLVVLRSVDLRLSPGDSLAIVGPSGSGKSTLLNILGTLDRPSSGGVTLDGIDPFALNERDLAAFRGRRVGFVFQDHHLLPQCTALENVLMARLAIGKVRDQDTARATELLDRVGLRDRATHLPAELSGGERQRVAVARALMNGPRLLLCDEPTGNLDSKNSQAIGQLLGSLCGDGQTIVIVVTHSAALAGVFARRARLEEGRLE